MKFYQSLQAKLTMSFLLLIIVVSGVAFLFTFGATKIALMETMQDEVKAIAAIVATQVDGDLHSTLNPGDEGTEVFKKIRDQLYIIEQSHSDILYVYTYVPHGDDLTAFIVDAEYGIEEAAYSPDDPEYGEVADAAEIGYVYEDTTEVMLNSFVDEPTVENEFVSDKWGTYLSGYAPIKNSEGEIVAALGIDMSSDTVLEKQDFIGSTIYWIIGFGVLVAAMIILYYAATISMDIKKLNKMAKDVSLGHIDVDIEVNRHDEIGQLADSFQRMVTSLRIVRMYPDDKKKNE